MNQIISYEQTAKLFGCSLASLKEDYRNNAKVLSDMYDKALSSNKKVNGYTANQLREMRDRYAKLAENCPI